MALNFPNIDPVIVKFGPFDIFGQTFEPALRWYGFTYLVGFVAAMWLLNRQADRSNGLWTREQVSDLLFYGFLGVILGGRIGYVLFYHFDYFLASPMYLFKISEGGMSFHGGLIGVITAMIYITWKQKRTFFAVADMVAPVVPIGLGAGRIGNFINGELWGRVTVCLGLWCSQAVGRNHAIPHSSINLLLKVLHYSCSFIGSVNVLRKSAQYRVCSYLATVFSA